MDSPVYKTYDLALASFLVSGDVVKLIDITSTGDGRKLFCFNPAPSKEQLIEFYAGTAKVSARKFAEVFATLKGSGYTLRDYA
jgi:hypothetical protein